MPGGGATVDFTFAHPHAVKATSRKAAIDEKFVQKLRFCGKWRKFMYFYLPGQADSYFSRMLFGYLSKDTRNAFRTAAGSSNSRLQGLTFPKNRRKLRSSKYWKEPSL